MQDVKANAAKHARVAAMEAEENAIYDADPEMKAWMMQYTNMQHNARNGSVQGGGSQIQDGDDVDLEREGTPCDSEPAHSEHESTAAFDDLAKEHERDGSVQGSGSQSIGIDAETMLEIESNLHRLRSGVDAEISRSERLLQIQEGRGADSVPKTGTSNLFGERRLFRIAMMAMMASLIAVTGLLVEVCAVLVVLAVMLIKRVLKS